jgi:hypothetical protein
MTLCNNDTDGVVDAIDDETENWPVLYEHRDLWEETKYTHQVQPVIAFDTNGNLIPAKLLNTKLKGSLCKVWFRIKHYRLKSERTDSFSGIIEQIVMLRPAHPKTPSPYRNREAKGPYRPRAVTPTPSHGELKRAADTFNPLPQYAVLSANKDADDVDHANKKRRLEEDKEVGKEVRSNESSTASDGSVVMNEKGKEKEV